LYGPVGSFIVPNLKVKSKVIPLQASAGLEVARGLRLSDFKIIGT
jgi:hypothetical protein